MSPEEIRFGLGALRGVGAGAVDSILQARVNGGAYRSLYDLVDRVDLRLVGRRVLEALIQAGACDSFGHRAQLMAGLEVAIRESQLRQIERESGQASLFDLLAPASTVAEPRSEPALPDVPRWSESERLAREKEILGFFISGHPLEKYADVVRIYQDVNTAKLKSYRDQKIELACVVTSVSRQLSKRNGAEWARIVVEDFFGTATVLAFSEAWELNQDVLVQDTPLLIRGSVSGRERDEESPPIFMDTATPLSAVWNSGQLAVEVVLPPNSEEIVTALGTIFRAHPGNSAVYVRWTPPVVTAAPDAVELEAESGGVATAAPPRRRVAQEKPVRLRARAFQVSPSQALLVELRAVLGADQVCLVRG